MIDRVLEIQTLSIDYPTDEGLVHAVREVSLTVRRGEIFGLVGESGCGKSTLAYALLGDLGEGGHRCSGSVLFKGQDMLSASARTLQRIRGAEIGMVHQNPGAALNPSKKVGTQLIEILAVHRGQGGKEAGRRAIEFLDRVHLSDATQLMNRYPHELSGGQQQRVVIAMALLSEPDLLVMDEPTTALDVTVEATILDLLVEINETFGVAIVYISHNLGVVARICDRVGVMYAGELVEVAAVADLFRQPRHPYTTKLLRCVPRLDQATKRTGLTPIPGGVPSPFETPTGCFFANRCSYANQTCRERRPVLEGNPSEHAVRCFRWREVDQDAGEDAFDLPRLEAARSSGGETLLVIDNLCVRYDGRGWFEKRRTSVRAVDGVSLSVRQGQILAIVGESGCGKSSLGAAVVGLRKPTAGRLMFAGVDITERVGRRDSTVHRLLQMIFQDHSATLNPSLSVGHIIGRPLRLFSRTSTKAIRDEIRRLLGAVELDEDTMYRKPQQLSGGQRQRVAIARAFAGKPSLVVCDEITSALDVSVQASILNFLLRLQRDNDTSLLFISHDLGVVRYLADLVVVMYLGQICESAAAEDFFAGPNHPYSEALLSAVPVPDPEAKSKRIRLHGPMPSALAPPWRMSLPHPLSTQTGRDLRKASSAATGNKTGPPHLVPSFI